MIDTLLLYLLTISCFLFSSLSQQVIIETDTGLVSGHIRFSRTRRHPIDSFEGIPYAQPPVGELRFKKPLPLKVNWEGVLDATYSPECLQACNWQGFIEVRGQEDCLYLNIYARTMTSNVSLLKPVVVYIHGGAFSFGSGSPRIYGPEVMLDYEDGILVTLNYRLGPLGFLTLESDEAPGNLGLWDQRLALQWINRNIQNFGGDVKQVTIVGQSAGGMSVLAHLVSPASKNLFTRAFMMSAVASSPFVHHSGGSPSPKEYAIEYATKFGECKSIRLNDEDLLTCLQSVDSHKLTSHLYDPVIYLNFPSHFKPTPDFRYASQPFFLDDPWVLIERGEFSQIPITMGYSSHEGELMRLPWMHDTNSFDGFIDDWHKFISIVFFARSDKDNAVVFNQSAMLYRHILERAVEEHNEVLTDTMKDGLLSHSISASELTLREKEAIVDTFVDFVGDWYFKIPIQMTVKHLSSHSSAPVHEYCYSHKGSFSIIDLLGSIPKLAWKVLCSWFEVPVTSFPNFKSPTHSDELLLIFKFNVFSPLSVMWRYGLSILDPIQNEIDMSVGRNFVSLMFRDQSPVVQRSLTQSSDSDSIDHVGVVHYTEIERGGMTLRSRHPCDMSCQFIVGLFKQLNLHLLLNNDGGQQREAKFETWNSSDSKLSGVNYEGQHLTMKDEL